MSKRPHARRPSRLALAGRLLACAWASGCCRDEPTSEKSCHGDFYPGDRFQVTVGEPGLRQNPEPSCEEFDGLRAGSVLSATIREEGTVVPAPGDICRPGCWFYEADVSLPPGVTVVSAGSEPRLGTGLPGTGMAARIAIGACRGEIHVTMNRVGFQRYLFLDVTSECPAMWSAIGTEEVPPTERSVCYDLWGATLDPL